MFGIEAAVTHVVAGAGRRNKEMEISNEVTVLPLKRALLLNQGSGLFTRNDVTNISKISLSEKRLVNGQTATNDRMSCSWKAIIKLLSNKLQWNSSVVRKSLHSAFFRSRRMLRQPSKVQWQRIVLTTTALSFKNGSKISLQKNFQFLDWYQIPLLSMFINASMTVSI